MSFQSAVRLNSFAPPAQPPNMPSSSYGRSCAGCVQAKCKCIVRLPGACERCRRLAKDCQPRETVRYRKQRAPTTSKNARLEQKLDRLVSLFSSDSPLRNSLSNDIRADFRNIRSNAELISTPPSDESANSESGASDTGISYIEAEDNLACFQRLKARHFPYVRIPSTTAAHELQQQRPFLWLCVMAISSKSTSEQQVLSSKIRQTVAQQIVCQSKTNLDHLLGLLLYLGWAQYQIQSKPFVTVLTQMAIGVVFELGLNNAVPDEAEILPCIKQVCRRSLKPRTNEERRAVLGCFFLSSLFSSFLQKIDTLRWTSHMEECLQILDDNNEFPEDKTLVEQIKLQLLGERLTSNALQYQAKKSDSQAQNYSCFYSSNVKSPLHELETRLLAVPELQETTLLHLYSLELEMAIPLQSIYTDVSLPHDSKRLIAAADALKSWFNVFLNIQPASYVGIPFSVYTQLLRCATTLHWFTNIYSGDLDRSRLWQESDPRLMMDQIISNFKQVRQLAGLDVDNTLGRDLFSLTANKLQLLQPSPNPQFEHSKLPGANNQVNMNDAWISELLGTDLFDNDWLMGAMLNYNL